MRINQINELRMGRRDLENVDTSLFKVGLEFEYIVPHRTSASGNTIPVLEHESKVLSKLLDKNVLEATISQTKYGDMTFQYFVTMDESIKVNDEWKETGVEFVTGIMDWDEAEPLIQKMFSYIEQNGYTNATCGMHVNLSFEDRRKPDLLKVIAFSGVDYLRQLFPRVAERNDNNLYHDNTRSNLASIRSAIESGTVTTAEQLLKHKTFFSFIENLLLYLDAVDDTAIMPDKSKYKRKSHIINVGRKEYVEFRAIGGANYHQRWSEVRDNILRFMRVMIAASDPHTEKKTYVKKLAQNIFAALEGEETLPGEDEDPNTIRKPKTSMGQELAKIFPLAAYDFERIHKESGDKALMIINYLQDFVTDRRFLNNKKLRRMIFEYLKSFTNKKELQQAIIDRSPPQEDIDAGETTYDDYFDETGLLRPSEVQKIKKYLFLS